MSASVAELFLALFEMVVFTSLSVGLTIAGASIERFAFVTLESGQPKLGVAIGWIGLMALVFAYLIATDKLRPKLATVVQTVSGE